MAQIFISFLLPETAVVPNFISLQNRSTGASAAVARPRQQQVMLNFRQNKGLICPVWVLICRWRGRTTTAQAAHITLDEVKNLTNSISTKIRDVSCLAPHKNKTWFFFLVRYF
ncbi:MAG: hypothetical protein IT262_02290 [Saprospiraceae bacterium]|nr:hypothetical protein [Saprospiraceae bacterium]